MLQRFRRFAWAVALIMVLPASASADDPIHKAGRGVANVLTAWVEVPKHLERGLHEDNPVGGALRGIGVGTGLALGRFVLGAYEAVTFPLPFPPGYASPYEELELPDYPWE